MGAKYGTEFRIAMGFAGVEVQTSADLILLGPERSSIRDWRTIL